MKIAIILYGPPGSGKSTQANLLSQKLDLIYFDTGRLLESIVHDPKRERDPVIRRERKLFDSGRLLTPSFVFKEVARHVKVIADAGWGIVFSGSPRTLSEAEGLFPILERLYGKKGIVTFILEIPERASVERNSRRLVCKICGAPLLTAYYPSKHPKHCPVCAGPLYKRTLDDPATIRVRLEEYRERTKPIFEFMRAKGLKIKKVDGTKAPYKVFQVVYDSVKNTRPH